MRRVRARLSNEVLERFAEALREGATLELAAHAAGVGFSSAREWIARGDGRHRRPSESCYVAFAQAARAARAESHLRRLRALVGGETFERVLAALSAPVALSEAA